MINTEALIITMEECGELIQACSKVIRSNHDPKYIQNLQDEIGDVLCMIEILDCTTPEQIKERIGVKKKKLKRWSTLYNTHQ